MMSEGDPPGPPETTDVWPPAPTGGQQMPVPQTLGLAPFIDLTKFTRVVVGLLVVNAILGTISSVLLADDGHYFTSPFVQDFGATIIPCSMLIVLVTVLVFMDWTNQAYSNLQALGISAPSESPRSAAAYFVVPLLNVYKPYVIFVEMWQRSDLDPAIKRSSDTPGVVTLWWLLFLIYSFAFALTFMFARATVQTAIAASAIEIMATMLAVMVVTLLTQRQVTRHRAILALRNASTVENAPKTE